MTALTRIGEQTDILGESPLWNENEQALYWVDIRRPALRRLDYASGRIETWKMPLFRLIRDANQRATPPLERIVPLEPVHQLFAKAWTRIVDGDVPKYEEVK